MLVHQADHDFWLSEKVAAKAPAKDQPYFKMARDTAAPYLAGGRWQTFRDGSELAPGTPPLPWSPKERSF